MLRLLAPRELVVGRVHAVRRGAAHPQPGEHVAAADGLLSTHGVDPPLRPERFLRLGLVVLGLPGRPVFEVGHEDARAAPVGPSQRVHRALPNAHPRYPRPPADSALARARGVGDAASSPGDLPSRIPSVRGVWVPMFLLRGWDEVVGIVLKLAVRGAPAGGIAEADHLVGGVRAMRQTAARARVAERGVVGRFPRVIPIGVGPVPSLARRARAATGARQATGLPGEPGLIRRRVGLPWNRFLRLASHRARPTVRDPYFGNSRVWGDDRVPGGAFAQVFRALLYLQS